MNLDKWKYLLKQHRKEGLSFIVGIISSFLAFKFKDSASNILIVNILISIISYIVTLYFILREKDFYFLSLDSYKDKENWFGSGKFEFDKTNSSYSISDTDAGFVFSKCLLWKDYSYSGEFKILNKHLGIILRATDLSNYIMLQITKESIRPHLMANGGWLVFEPKDTGLNFEKNIKEGEWCRFEFVVKGDVIEIKIFNSKNDLINDKSWSIPYGRISIPVYKKEDNNRKTSTHVFDTTSNYDYGTIGLRDGHGERALVRKLLIENINNKFLF